MAAYLALTAELEAMLLRRLHFEWEQINWALFGDAMRAPLLLLSDRAGQLGAWNPVERSIALQRAMVLTRPWPETLETLKHEAAHQFVHEVLKVDEAPHGPVFRRVCRERGIDHRATGAGTPDPDADPVQARVVARVQKLLALAESGNRHEAELAASTAQRIMLKHNLEVVRASPDAADDCDHLWLGQPTGRVQLHERTLGALLVEHFFVEAIWIPVYRPHDGKRGTVLEICGRPENLAMAEYVHAFVLRTIERLWKEHKRAMGIRSNRPRRSFLAGAVAGFSDKLAAGKRKTDREGLIWVGDASVGEYFGRRHPRTRSTGRSTTGDRRAYAEGHSAGRQIVLSRPVADRASRAEQRALPAPR